MCRASNRYHKNILSNYSIKDIGQDTEKTQLSDTLNIDCVKRHFVNPLTAKLLNRNFHLFEAVSRCAIHNIKLGKLFRFYKIDVNDLL